MEYSNENRRKSKRLTEKCEKSVNFTKTKKNNKSKPNEKSVKLKEIVANVGSDRKTRSLTEKPLNGMTRKYGLRKLAPINWRERLDTRHTSPADQTLDCRQLVDNRHCFESNNSKTENKRNKNKSNNRLNSRIETKCNATLDNSIDEKSNKRKKIKTNYRVSEEVIDKSLKTKRLKRNGIKTDFEDKDSTQESVLLSERQLDLIEEQIEPKQQTKEDIPLIGTYFEFLDKSNEYNYESTFPPLSLNIVTNILKQKSKNRNNFSKRTEKQLNLVKTKRKLYSCGYELCDSKRCQNFIPD